MLALLYHLFNKSCMFMQFSLFYIGLSEFSQKIEDQSSNGLVNWDKLSSTLLLVFPGRVDLCLGFSESSGFIVWLLLDSQIFLMDYINGSVCTLKSTAILNGRILIKEIVTPYTKYEDQLAKILMRDTDKKNILMKDLQNLFTVYSLHA